VADHVYSPRLRTGLVLCGAGTAGAYQTGVLRALAEAGVKIDVVAGHGAGVMTALCGAVDGGARLWDGPGLWTDVRLRRAYRWRPALRAGALSLVVAAATLLAPLVVLLVAAALYVASLLAALINLPGTAARLVGTYQRAIEVLFSPPLIPTIVPRLVVLAVLVVAAVLVVSAVRAVLQERSRRRVRGAFWWRLLGAPLDAAEPAATFIEALWRLVRGASNAPRPSPADIGRRYVDLLVDNAGQPGFREVVVGVHDLDARRDLIGMVLAGGGTGDREPSRRSAGPREAEAIDLTGPQRDLVVDLLAGALRLPVASAPHRVHFPVESYWRGETHQVCDRPELVVRLVEELAGAGVEQLVLVSPAPPGAQPYGMRSRPADLRGRMGEVLRSVETAAVQDAWAAAVARFSGVFVIRPDHNPIGPFEFRGSYDEASDRRRTIPELVEQGYHDAYSEFIEPIVASGERVDAL
jgi:Patatin-like phospholipase